MWHKDCTHKRVKIYKKDNLLYFEIARVEDREEDIPDVGKVVLKASVKQTKKQNNKLKYHFKLGGPDVHKPQKTAKIACFDVSGSLPESEIKEIEAVKMKAVFPRIIPKTTKPEEKNKVYVWDMIGKFKVISVGGAYYSHDAVGPVLGLRFVFPVKRAHADAFIEVLTNFIAFLGTLPTNFVFKVFRADAGTVYKAKSV